MRYAEVKDVARLIIIRRGPGRFGRKENSVYSDIIKIRNVFIPTVNARIIYSLKLDNPTTYSGDHFGSIQHAPILHWQSKISSNLSESAKRTVLGQYVEQSS